MMNNYRYTVFDVETPNFANDRMSAIGFTVVENMKIAGSYYTLVDPETHFDDFNIELTGITPEAVKGKRNFLTLWNDGLCDYLTGNILVAHNAAFDMGVLAKCMRHYGITAPTSMKYACTVRMSRKALPNLPNHKLNTVSDYLGIELLHHHAGSDAYAAAEILLYCLKNGCDIGDFIRTYSI